MVTPRNMVKGRNGGIFMKNLRRALCLLLAGLLLIGLDPVYAAASEEAAIAAMQMMQQEALTLELTEDGVYGGLYDVDGGSGARVVMLTNCAIRMTYETSSLYLEFVTGCNYEADEIGVTDIKVQKQKGIFWETWETIATSEGGYENNSYDHIGNCTCTSVVKGETYRVSCTHYAYVRGVYYSLENVTDGHKFV